VADEKAKESQMLTVTKEAAELLKAAKAAENAPDYAGIRIRRWVVSNGNGGVAVGFAISEDPSPDDEEFEQEGLRIFVEDALIEPLDGRILDVREASEGPELVFR
jgi:iron-sulfur cluster assembly protein